MVGFKGWRGVRCDGLQRMMSHNKMGVYEVGSSPV